MLPSPRRDGADGSRRGVSAPLSRRATLAAAGVALVTATAGCSDVFDDNSGDSDDENDEDALVAKTPSETPLLAHLDVAQIAGDDAEAELEALVAADPGDVDGAMTAFAARTGLDPLEADELLVFGEADADADADANSDADNGDLADDILVRGGWETADVVDSLEAQTGITYEETTYLDEAVLYEPSESGPVDVTLDTTLGDESEDDTPDDATTVEPAVLGVLEDDAFVVGSESVVEAVLDVEYDGADAVSGFVRDAYGRARGAQLTVASASVGTIVPEQYRMLIDDDPFEDAEAIGRSYAVTDAGIALEVGLHAADEDEAAELEADLEGTYVPILADVNDAFDEARDDLEIDRDGTVVELRYEGDSEAVFALLDEV